ncbi:hypothetical protein GGI15_003612 [Coemansia interrupta]|uniref:Uncharacterized protein n=1 Tax=Coemansia interrupta TaxID=1126814 RepID=A0A9W8LHH3_9FUNG|nr:hypothetical protein GGI15_003612 [Coemansia interrupta]
MVRFKYRYICFEVLQYDHNALSDGADGVPGSSDQRSRQAQAIAKAGSAAPVIGDSTLASMLKESEAQISSLEI